MPAQGCALATLGKRHSFLGDATLKELRRRSLIAKQCNSFRVAKNLWELSYPGFQSKPWAGIRERFRRYRGPLSFLTPLLLSVVHRSGIPVRILHRNVCNRVRNQFVRPGRLLFEPNLESLRADHGARVESGRNQAQPANGHRHLYRSL